MASETDDMFMADPLPRRPPGSDPTAHHAQLDTTIQGEMADRSALYDEEELDQMAREQYEPVSSKLQFYSVFKCGKLSIWCNWNGDMCVINVCWFSSLRPTVRASYIRTSLHYVIIVVVLCGPSAPLHPCLNERSWGGEEHKTLSSPVTVRPYMSATCGQTKL